VYADRAVFWRGAPPRAIAFVQPVGDSREQFTARINSEIENRAHAIMECSTTADQKKEKKAAAGSYSTLNATTRTH
jgi:hypothetical protein